jgi:hypothetical protein
MVGIPPESAADAQGTPEEGAPGTESADRPAKRLRIMVEYTLDSRGGRTVLRLVHSGIPNTPDWDGFYDGTDYGWEAFFGALRHYLERHAGKPRDNMVVMRPIRGNPPDARSSAWDRLIDALGLAQGASAPGSRYRATTSAGDQIQDEVVPFKAPKIVVLTIDEMDNAFLWASLEEMGGVAYFYLSLPTCGLQAGRTQSIHERWKPWIDQTVSMSGISRKRRQPDSVSAFRTLRGHLGAGKLKLEL